MFALTVINVSTVALEDEVGDVLEKAMRRSRVA